MLLGKNPDGSDRVEYRDDPSWSPPSESGDANDSGWSTIAEPIFTDGMSWADAMDDDDAYHAKIASEKQRHICPKIAFPLEPLMVLPAYHLSSLQISEKRAKIIEENNGKPGFDPKLVDIPPIAYFCVEPALVKPVEDKFMPNILKCKNVPEWVTKEELKGQFSPYVSDSETFHERYIKGRRVEETYPFVNINDDRVAFIIFDSTTHDGSFALHMMMKTIITKQMPDKTVNKVTLIFGYSFRTDRDMMADITQRPRPVQPRDSSSNRSLNKPSHSSNPPRHSDGNRDIHRSPQHSILPSQKQVTSAKPWPKKIPEAKNAFSALNSESDSDSE